jgi:hypothetical protein
MQLQVTHSLEYDLDCNWTYKIEHALADDTSAIGCEQWANRVEVEQ